jgi:hypothetical protein
MESKKINLEKQYNYSKAGKISMQKNLYLINKNKINLENKNGKCMWIL